MRKKTVVVAMSGGVDSSVAAALLKKQGYEVMGVTMYIQPTLKGVNQLKVSTSYSAENTTWPAQQVAEKLDIPHRVVDLREVFTREVIYDFCQNYIQGKTPNPCIRCNTYIKFGALLEQALKMKADFLATGHYARLEFDEKRKRYLLKKGVDKKKDQSYVLYIMTQEQLRHTLMPLGSFTKSEVRNIARQLELPVAEKSESQEICFIPDNNYPQFVKSRFPAAARPGPIINRKGEILGSHKGLIYYTIGQRRGLTISSEKPFYVISIDKETNTIMVGEKKDSYSQKFLVSKINWIAFKRGENPFQARVKIRYMHRESMAYISPVTHDQAWVKFLKPQRAITPGQAAVFYLGDIVIGGGTIDQVIIEDKGTSSNKKTNKEKTK